MSIRLVLIEDHHALRTGLELLLTARGCVIVGAAATADEGRALIERHAPDVAVVDVHLGDGNGIDLTRELVGRDAACRIVLYTGSCDGSLVAEGLDAGAAGYALKEGDPDELMEAIQVAHAGDRYLDPRLDGFVADLAPVVAVAAPSPTLTKRERQIMDLLACGLTGEQVADQLVLSAETIKTHIRNAMGKLEASTRVHAVALALRDGEISPPPALVVARP